MEENFRVFVYRVFELRPFNSESRFLFGVEDSNNIFGRINGDKFLVVFADSVFEECIVGQSGRKYTIGICYALDCGRQILQKK